ncbi:hypothetical protein TURU_058905 [Turdus rufiventris]|nr:hypothetical protein TURU_058905 [Turdus rufiventris]
MRDAMEYRDSSAVATLQEIQEDKQAFPVVYTPNTAGGVDASISPLDWKVLMQLRNMVNKSGLRGEPTKQVLNCIWGAGLLLQEDIKNLFKMIVSQSQVMLWQVLCQEAVNVQRGPGDPLCSVMLDHLMGTGNFATPEAQAMLGPDLIKETMRLARLAYGKVRTDRGAPSYMSVKQGNQESFSTFVDRVSAAIERAGVPMHMQGTLLRECVMQNCNPQTKAILVTLPGDWGVGEYLDHMSKIPQGMQAMLVEAVKDLMETTKRGQFQAQAFAAAALQPLRASRGQGATKPNAQLMCFRCGKPGHMRKECRAGQVWCQNCQADNHSMDTCRKKSGNGCHSARGRGTMTPTTAQACPVFPSSLPAAYTPPQEAASVWTWQPQ